MNQKSFNRIILSPYASHFLGIATLPLAYFILQTKYSPQVFFGNSFSTRQVEQEMETVIKVLQPGPLGIVEHKFSDEEIGEASATVQRAVVNWQRNANLERRSGILKDFIHK